MLEISETPGFYKCLQFNEDTSLHCTSSCERDGVYVPNKKGIDICINIKLPDGGSTTVVLPLENKKELKMFLDYIKKDFVAMYETE